MKVIDLLNRIANGEEIPQLIKWNGYVYDKLGCEYYLLNDRDITLFGDILDTNGEYLNDEIEIIEEDKKIEKLKWNEKSSYNQEGDTKKVQKILLSRSEQLKSSINEIIDYLEEKEQ